MPYNDFRELVVGRYYSELKGSMSRSEIYEEFDLGIGKHGYREIVAEMKSQNSLGKKYDPVAEACRRLDRL